MGGKQRRTLKIHQGGEWGLIPAKICEVGGVLARKVLISHGIQLPGIQGSAHAPVHHVRVQIWGMEGVKGDPGRTVWAVVAPKKKKINWRGKFSGMSGFRLVLALS